MSNTSIKKPLLIIVFSVLIIIVGVVAFLRLESLAMFAPTAQMSMFQDHFEPATLTVKKGTRVTFINRDNAPHWPASDLHPTHGIYPEFDPQIGVQPGKKWSFTFNKIGNWKYHDHLNPQTVGIIKVVE